MRGKEKKTLYDGAYVTSRASPRCNSALSQNIPSSLSISGNISSSLVLPDAFTPEARSVSLAVVTQRANCEMHNLRSGRRRKALPDHRKRNWSVGEMMEIAPPLLNPQHQGKKQ